jgi:hypothetical protein
VAYAHHASRLDKLRSQHGTPIELAPPQPLVQLRLNGRA